ncbi:hypothetical protein FOL47_001019 [Perkinsus chesapeaki]|uniref:Uncharacterized protein n=1 Tax=Perkinsus chesapeaki TaxID=330153 RepID=A0A7J6MK88_PERCH|nr:hypothetical protein FOL47_001019 [Perkinsus chesapeaki]
MGLFALLTIVVIGITLGYVPDNRTLAMVELDSHNRASHVYHAGESYDGEYSVTFKNPFLDLKVVVNSVTKTLRIMFRCDAAVGHITTLPITKDRVDSEVCYLKANRLLRACFVLTTRTHQWLTAPDTP